VALRVFLRRVRSHLVIVVDMLKVNAVIELLFDLGNPRAQPSRAGATETCDHPGDPECCELVASLRLNTAALEPTLVFFAACLDDQWECFLDDESVVVVALADAYACC